MSLRIPPVQISSPAVSWSPPDVAFEPQRIRSVNYGVPVHPVQRAIFNPRYGSNWYAVKLAVMGRTRAMRLHQRSSGLGQQRDAAGPDHSGRDSDTHIEPVQNDPQTETTLQAYKLYGQPRTEAVDGSLSKEGADIATQPAITTKSAQPTGTKTMYIERMRFTYQLERQGYSFRTSAPAA